MFKNYFKTAWRNLQKNKVFSAINMLLPQFNHLTQNAMNKWLQDYAYKIHITWWMFVFAGMLAILIALITVSLQAIKAAVANPVKSLRTE